MSAASACISRCYMIFPGELFDSNLLFRTNELVRYCCLISRAWKLLAAHTAGVGTCRSTPAEPLITIDELEKDGRPSTDWAEDDSRHQRVG
jgi:hypothetical protein